MNFVTHVKELCPGYFKLCPYLCSKINYFTIEGLDFHVKIGLCKNQNINCPDCDE